MTFLIQSVGAVLISKIFILWYAPCFIKREDRRNVFVSLLLVSDIQSWKDCYRYIVKSSTKELEILKVKAQPLKN